MILYCNYTVRARRQRHGLSFYLEPNSDTELEKYKKAIYRQCYGRNDWPKKPNLRECNKLVSAFKKLIADPHAVADLMLYYVEQTTSLPAQFGDFGEAYSISLENNGMWGGNLLCRLDV